MKIKRSILLLVITILLGAALSGMAAEVQLTARVDKNPVAEDEQFVYEIEITGTQQNLPDVEFPDLSQFAILSGPNVSSSFQIVNFKVSASKTYSFILMPKKVGRFTIGPARAKYKGKEIRSNSVTVQVVKQSSRPRTTTPSQRGTTRRKQSVNLGNAVFLKVIPSRKTAYVNQQVLLRYKIYFRVNITDNKVLKLPEAVGCWVEEFPEPQRPRIYTEAVNGVRYNVAEIRKVAIFPSRPGKITVSPLEMMIEAVLPRRRNPMDIFDEFFSDPFGQVVRKKISSGAIQINVLPLPEQGKPADFTGLVGDFRIHYSLDKQTCKTNEAISYKVKLSGKGLLKFLNELPLKHSPDFEVYEPKITRSVSKTGAEVISNKEFEYVLIPRVPGDLKIEALRLSYFNPDDRQYHFLEVPEFVVHVLPGKNMPTTIASDGYVAKEAVKLLGQDIRFIKDNIPAFYEIGHMPYATWWFWGVPLLSLLVLGLAWGYRVHLDRMSRDVRYARSRKAHRQAKSRLKKARGLLQPEQAASFYGEVSRALLGYLADKTNQPAAGLVREQVVKLLKEYQVEESLAEEFLKCLDEADFRRFAPGTPTREEMQQFYQRAEKLLVRMAKYF